MLRRTFNGIKVVTPSCMRGPIIVRRQLKIANQSVSFGSGAGQRHLERLLREHFYEYWCMY